MQISATKPLQGISERLLSLLFPPACNACGAALADGESHAQFCDECFSSLPLSDQPVCSRCAARTPQLDDPEPGCVHCRRENIHFDRTFALGDYDGLLRALILQMKTDSSHRIAKCLARLAEDRHGEQLRELAPDAVVSVPMPIMRRWKRGVNSAEALAAALGARFGWPLAGELLRKARKSNPQTGLTRAGRFRNIRRQITPGPGYFLKSAHVLLVDDVLTTGATCSEAARILKRMGAARVSVFVAARTPE